ncbi:MAG: HdeD family acid-resistance protein [Nocardioidaceae bacterium]
MSEMRRERVRTNGDVVVGAVLFIIGLVLLANATFATTVSVLFLGWMVLAAGILGLVAALFSIGRAGFWSAAIGGTMLTVLGLVTLRHTDAAAVTLTLLAGAMFLVSGLMRLAASAEEYDHRVELAIAGGASLVLGLIVLFNLFTASYVLLGVLLGVQLLVDGLALMMVGRMHAFPSARSGGAAVAH